MEHEIDGFTVYWTCEACGTNNEDYFNFGGWPGCTCCQEGYDWQDVLDQSEIDELLSKLDPDRYGHLGEDN